MTTRRLLTAIPTLAVFAMLAGCPEPGASPSADGSQLDGLTADTGETSADSVADANDLLETSICVPDCAAKACGNDGCGGSCGLCVGGTTCDDGACVEPTCPNPLVEVAEGAEVIPQTKLHLSVINPDGSPASLDSYKWSVDQPTGSQSVFLPNAAHPNPTLEANVAGTYILTLEVPSPPGSDLQCPTHSFTVGVLPDEAIHVELLWHTPGDLDETDTGPEAGADMDLHFAHELGSDKDIDGDGVNDPWFHAHYDTYWFNAQPNWASLDPLSDDDPSLDRDDTDGAGPENCNLGTPEDGVTYFVGAHYWHAHTFGPSLATVRIYIHGALAAEFSDVEMVDGDFWQVATIAWPSGEITAIPSDGGGPNIIENVANPLFN